jgi:RNA polymerase sigma factor (sigma-70 family)
VSVSDRDLVQRLTAGDRRAGAELVRRYADRGLAVALRMLRNRQDAEEAVQDAFVRVFRSVDRFEWKSSFATWFYRIVFNASASMAEQRKRRFEWTDDEWIRDVAAFDTVLPDRIAEDAELDRIVREEIERLPADAALVMTLFVLHEQSYEEIVAITGLPLGTVKNRLFRARLKLRDAVTAHYRVHGAAEAERNTATTGKLPVHTFPFQQVCPD